MAGLEIQLLGNFTFRYNDSPLQRVNTPRIQTLLIYLLLHRSTPQPRSYLAYLLWPDSTEIQARTNLRNLFHSVRNVLPAADDFLQADSQTLQWWANAPCGLDVEDFETAIHQAKTASLQKDPLGCLAALEHAISLYQGDLVPSCYMDWIMPERERLRQLYLKNLDWLIRLSENQQDYHAAIGYANNLLIYDPLQEANYRKLMRLYAMHGDRAGVERVYQACSHQLRQELKVQPSLATRQVYERLIHAVEKPLKTTSDLPVHPGEKSALVGRASEWQQLESVCRSALAGKACFVLLSGSAGSGKTRLGQELLNWAASQEIKTAAANCYATESELPFAPVIAWLRSLPLPAISDTWKVELTRIWPEIRAGLPGTHLPRMALENYQSYALFEALAWAILGDHQPLILFLDDLQWCDRFTLEWLHFLLHFDPQAPLLMIGTLRSEETLNNAHLNVFFQTLHRQEVFTEIALNPLDEDQTAELVSNMIGRTGAPSLAARIFRYTEGNPLFIVETIEAGLFNPGNQTPGKDFQITTNQDCPLLPSRIQNVLADRLAHLSANAIDLVNLAVHLDEVFSYDVLKRVSFLDEVSLVKTLDELMERHIIKEKVGGELCFSHNLIRVYVQATQSIIRQQSLQRRIAEASSGS